PREAPGKFRGCLQWRRAALSRYCSKRAAGTPHADYAFMTLASRALHDPQLEHLTVAERNARNAKLSSYAERPLAFLLSYIRRQPFSHAIVLTSVFAAVGCALA